MFEAIRDLSTLTVIVLRMHGIQVKILKGKRLTEDEEKQLKLNLFGVREGEFRDKEHRDRLLEQWWKGAKILYKKLEEEERKKK